MSERSDRTIGSVRGDALEQSGPRGCAWRLGPFAERSEVEA